MILSIDFGAAVAKVLIVKDNNFEVVEVPLGFRTRPRMTVPNALRYVIKTAVGDAEPEVIYVSGEIASMELKEIITAAAVDPVEVLKKLELPLVVVGAGITFADGQARRGENLALRAEEIARWLPFKINLSEVQNFFANKEIYPQIVPTTERAHKLEQAAARVRVQGIGDRVELEDYIVASGGVLSKAPSPSQAILMLLDSLQPEGLLKIYLDTQQLLPALGTLAVYQEENAQAILDQEPLDFLGTTFSAANDIILQIDLGLSEPQELEVKQRNLAVFPLDEGQVATVKFETKSQKGEFEAQGGPCGLIIDARGRPLELPSTEGERIKVLQEWEEDICRYPLFKK
jgi:hypothetical protein